MAVAGASEGVAVLALEQTAGRGRHGRAWSSPAGEGLYLSIILRPPIPARQSPFVTLASAVAVAETLSALGVQADIKWPNDVLANGRKICGILVESAIESDRLQFAVLGIGVNVAQRSFPSDLAQPATSIFLELGRRIPLDEVASAILVHADQWYREALRNPAHVVSRWEQLSTCSRDCEVLISSPEGWLEGVTRGLTPGGALAVELKGGEIREIVSGEVSLRALARDH
jgi:BirA family biotin operon repressor/biotin-[acetyl-CoA-carboxylase] ligase